MFSLGKLGWESWRKSRDHPECHAFRVSAALQLTAPGGSPRDEPRRGRSGTRSRMLIRPPAPPEPRGPSQTSVLEMESSSEKPDEDVSSAAHRHACSCPGVNKIPPDAMRPRIPGGTGASTILRSGRFRFNAGFLLICGYRVCRLRRDSDRYHASSGSPAGGGAC